MSSRAWWILLAVPLAAAAGEAPLPGDPSAPRAAAPPPKLQPKVQNVGIATISHDRLDGHTTASGEQYNRNALAAAHRSLPLGTLVRVTNVKNQRTVVVRVNDRSAGIGNHIIDLTPRAAAMIGLHGISVGEVRLDIIGAAATPDAADTRRPPGDPAAAPVK